MSSQKVISFALAAPIYFTILSENASEKERKLLHQCTQLLQKPSQIKRVSLQRFFDFYLFLDPEWVKNAFVYNTLAEKAFRVCQQWWAGRCHMRIYRGLRCWIRYGTIPPCWIFACHAYTYKRYWLPVTYKVLHERPFVVIAASAPDSLRASLHRKSGAEILKFLRTQTGCLNWRPRQRRLIRVSSCYSQ